MTALCQLCGTACDPRRVVLHGVQLASGRCDTCLAPLWARIAEQRLVFEASIAAGVGYAEASRIMTARLAGAAVRS